MRCSDVVALTAFCVIDARIKVGVQVLSILSRRLHSPGRFATAWIDETQFPVAELVETNVRVERL